MEGDERVMDWKKIMKEKKKGKEYDQGGSGVGLRE